MKITTRKFLISLYAITAIAFIIRIALGYTLIANKSFHILNPYKGTDAFTYLKFAEQIANGEWKEAYYYQPLYYSWFLAPLFMIFGPSVTVIIWAQSILGALTVFITGLFGARLYSRKAGLLAAFLLCFYKNHILYTPYALMATLQTFLLTAFIYFFFRYMKENSWKFLLSAALFCSLSILCRGNCILIMPVCLAVVLFKHRRQTRTGALKAAAFLVIIYGLQIPFSLHNYRLEGKWSPSTAGDIVLAIGNNPQAPPGTDYSLHYMDSTDAYKHWIYLKDRKENPVPLKSSISSWILSEPMEWLELKARVAMLFFSRHEGYNNVNLDITREYASWFKFPFISFWVIAVPFCTALLFSIFTRSFRKGSRNFIFTASLIYVGSIVLFYFLSRYRLPIAPVMIVVGSAFTIQVFRYKNGVKKRLKLLIPLCLVSGAVILGGFDFYRKNMEAWVMSKLHSESHQVPWGGKDFIMRDTNTKLWGGYKTHRVEDRETIIKGFKSRHFKTIGKHKCSFLLNIIPEQPDTEVKFLVTHRGKTFLWNANLKNPGEKQYIRARFESDFQEEEELIQLDLQVNKPIKIMYTTQRNYWRSMLKGELIDGEWDGVLLIEGFNP